MSDLGRFLLFMGIFLAVLGLALTLSDKIPWLGKLPGDLTIKGKNGTFYFPLATCLILSAVLTVVLNLFGRK